MMALTLNHLFAVIMLSGAFSLVSAMLFVVMDAVDVAFTEAAVGAGVSTVLMLATMALTVRIQKETKKPILLPLVVVCLVGVLLIYGTLEIAPHTFPFIIKTLLSPLLILGRNFWHII